MADALAPRYARYPAEAGPEWMLVHGPDAGARVLILGALLNEGHLLRALTVACVAVVVPYVALGLWL